MGVGENRAAPLLPGSVWSQSVDQVAAPLKFHAGPVMLPSCSPTPSLEGGQVLTHPYFFLWRPMRGRQAGQATQMKSLLSPEWPPSRVVSHLGVLSI